jgi:hypothetical protein
VEWVDGTGGAEFDLLVPVAGCSGVQQQAELKTRPFQFSPRMGVENDAACWVGRGFPARFYFISSRTEFSSPDALFFSSSPSSF